MTCFAIAFPTIALDPQSLLFAGTFVAAWSALLWLGTWKRPQNPPVPDQVKPQGES